MMFSARALSLMCVARRRQGFLNQMSALGIGHLELLKSDLHYCMSAWCYGQPRVTDCLVSRPAWLGNGISHDAT